MTEEHAKVERELSAASARVAELEQCTADYRKDEELHRLSEGRLREQLSAVQAHVLCTDERCRELSKMREQAYEERLRAQDEAKAAMRQPRLWRSSSQSFGSSSKGPRNQPSLLRKRAQNRSGPSELRERASKRAAVSCSS